MTLTPVKDMVAAAKEQITSLSCAEAQAAVKAGGAMMVDLRDIRELDRDGRIHGAFHAPRGMLEFWVDPSSPYHKPPLATDKQLILFCSASWRSALSALSLQNMGHENVAEMQGGFTAWREAEMPIVRNEEH